MPAAQLWQGTTTLTVTVAVRTSALEKPCIISMLFANELSRAASAAATNALYRRGKISSDWGRIIAAARVAWYEACWSNEESIHCANRPTARLMQIVMDFKALS